MTIYKPIACPDLIASRSTLYDLRWARKVLDANFTYPKSDGRLFLHVHFESADMVRVLDEFPLSTEDGDKVGLVANHFAYLVQDGPFLVQQSAVWRSMTPGIKHFQFVTGGYCLDVLSRGEPQFRVI